jgi:Putative  PD-(D/E)XK family member, (DUF4420)
MKTKIEQIWDDIAEASRARPIEQDGYVLRRIDPQFKFNVFGGVDSSGNVLLAVGVSRTPPAIRLESASLDYFRQRRADGSWLMALRLRQPPLTGVFGRLCQDLVDAAAAVTDEPALVALVGERLQLWKKLFDHGTRGQLELYQIKGLIAELLVLESTIHAGIRSPLEVVTAWMGPFQSDQDFQFFDEAVEVKAVSPNSESLSISSLQQLDSVLPIRLTVQTMRPASPGEEHAIGLNTLIPRIEGLLAGSPVASKLFATKVEATGYIESPYYDEILFHLIASENFAVTAPFPKLTPAAVPAGITAATYVLSLDKIRNLARDG